MNKAAQALKTYSVYAIKMYKMVEPFMVIKLESEDTLVS